jgi:Ca-activated chloride channel family protein
MAFVTRVGRVAVGGIMRHSRPLWFWLAGFFSSVGLACLLLEVAPAPVFAATPSQGSLQIVSSGQLAGFCPLRHTDVKVGISGLIARVAVTQDFENTSSEKIEAVYTFLLPQDAAVDDMTIRVGARTIHGVIKRREEAAAIYTQAVQRGKMAALLDQERPNIFSQRIGNIPAGVAVHVSISFLMRLKYEQGGYEFVFPMVVGPRYIPGTKAVGHSRGGVAPDTEKVCDASKITPPIAPPGTRAGHDISIALALDAGVPIQDLRSPSHQIDVERLSASAAIVRLRNAGEIPNKDFILRYDVAGTAIVEGLLTYTAPASARLLTASANPKPAVTNGYFSLIVQPPERFPESDVTPKELIFVLDSSGSMNGFPVEKSKQLIDYAIDGLYPGDTFNVIKFSGETAILFEEPVYPTAENVLRAKEFVNSQWGGGGTEMMKAIRAALAPSGSSDHVRIVVFLTDGYVGNDMEIISEVQKHANARVFAYGIGSSVNRFLLDKMAEAGHGEVEYVSSTRNDQEAETVAHRLYEHLRAPLLTDVSLDFGSLPVAEVYPSHIPDLYASRPIMVTGRYTAAGQGVIRLVAKRAGEPYTREIPVSFAAQNQNNYILASLWARERINDLMSQDWAGLQRGAMRDDLRQQITQIGLDYRLMTQFTSFVAVEEQVVTEGGTPKRIQVPVELPEGVQYEQAWFGGADRAKLAVPQRVRVSGGVVGGVPGGQLGGVIGGIVSSSPAMNGTGSVSGVGNSGGAGIGPGVGGGFGGGVYRVGGGVSAPRAIYAPAPEYSEEARKTGHQGTVVLWAIIGPDGRPREVKVARALGMGLDERAIEAVRRWRFEPATKDGKPVAVQMNIEVAFANGVSKTSFSTENANVTPVAVKSSRSIDTKLHPQLVAAYDCWQAQANKSKAADICKLDSDKILVQVIVSGESAPVLPLLQAVGFEPVAAKVRPGHFAGRIAVQQLAALAEIKVVQFVTLSPGRATATQ